MKRYIFIVAILVNQFLYSTDNPSGTSKGLNPRYLIGLTAIPLTIGAAYGISKLKNWLFPVSIKEETIKKSVDKPIQQEKKHTNKNIPFFIHTYTSQNKENIDTHFQLFTKIKEEKTRTRRTPQPYSSHKDDCEIKHAEPTRKRAPQPYAYVSEKITEKPVDKEERRKPFVDINKETHQEKMNALNIKIFLLRAKYEKKLQEIEKEIVEIRMLLSEVNTTDKDSNHYAILMEQLDDKINMYKHYQFLLSSL